MKFNTLAKIGSIAVGGALVVSALTWTGGNDLEVVKEILTQKQGKLELFQANETKLIDKVQVLKSEVAGVSSELEELKAQAIKDQEKIQALETEKEGLLAEIERLEGELSNMIDQEEANNLRNEVTRLEGELTQANADALSIKEYAEGLAEILPQDISGIIGEGSGDIGGVTTPEIQYKDNFTPQELNKFLTDNGGNAVVKSFGVSGGVATIQVELYELNDDTQLLIDGIKGIPAGSEITAAGGSTLYTWR